MRILTRYIITSILKIAVVTILIFALILAAVELFSKMDQIMNSSLNLSSIILYVLLSIPQYMLMVASIAFLFAVTYFLSTLTANNELIALLNAGISSVRMKFPVFVLALILTVIGFFYQEDVVIRLNAWHDRLETELFGSSSTRDVRNIVLTDPDGFMIYTTRYSETSGEIAAPVLIKYSSDRILARVESNTAVFSEDTGAWVFNNARVYTIDGENVKSENLQSWSDPLFDIEPRLFRSQNTSIETMDKDTAREYLSRLASTDRASWQEDATDYYRRIYSPLAIFVLIFISLCMNYRFKKNVLLFSVIQSLSIAVVYYVADMVFSIMGHQGAVSPVSTVVMPLVLTVLLSLVISLVGKKL